MFTHNEILQETRFDLQWDLKKPTTMKPYLTLPASSLCAKGSSTSTKK
jgi:hypothetical protein